MDIGTISLILLVGLMLLLAIGMPLGLASAVMAVSYWLMKFNQLCYWIRQRLGMVY